LIILPAGQKSFADPESNSQVDDDSESNLYLKASLLERTLSLNWQSTMSELAFIGG
jgi:hypothetical protein